MSTHTPIVSPSPAISNPDQPDTGNDAPSTKPIGEAKRIYGGPGRPKGSKNKPKKPQIVITKNIYPAPDRGTPTLSLNEAANELRVSVRTIHTMAKDGRLPSIKIGTRRLIPRAGLLAFIESNTQTIGGHAA